MKTFCEEVADSPIDDGGITEGTKTEFELGIEGER